MIYRKIHNIKISKQLFLKLITKEELIVVYNQMIKQKVDTIIMKNVSDKHFESLEEYNESGFNELNKIFNRIKKHSLNCSE